MEKVQLQTLQLKCKHGKDINKTNCTYYRPPDQVFDTPYIIHHRIRRVYNKAKTPEPSSKHMIPDHKYKRLMISVSYTVHSLRAMMVHFCHAISAD